MQHPDTEPTKLHLHALVLRRGEWYVSVCLEHCVSSQARTEDGALEELRRIINANIRRAEAAGCEPFAGIPRAPKRFWEMYRDGVDLPRLSGAGEDLGGLQPVVELRAA